MYVRADRFLLDPLRIWPTVFMVQGLVWYFGFPERPTIPAAAPRYFSSTALTRFLVLFAFLVAGLLIGRLVASLRDYRRRPGRPLITRLRTYRTIAFVALLLAVVGELAYVRPVLRDPSIIASALLAGDFANISRVMNAGQVMGLTSLVNLYLVPTAVYSMLAFSVTLPPRVRRRFGKRLFLIGAFVLLHALLFSGRMFFIYFMAVVAAAYLLGKPRRAIKLRYVLLLAMMPALIIWLGATIRDGGRYAVPAGVGYFHPDTQRYVRDVLIQGYFGADFNNALVLLGCEPKRELVSSTMFAAVARKMGYAFRDTAYCFPENQSLFGTVNTMALWWMDLGWLAIGVSLLVGAAVAYLHQAAQAHKIGLWTVLFLLAYPGIFSTIRINYFFLTIFMLPMAYVVLTATGLYLFARRPRRVVRRVAGAQPHPSHV